MSENMDQWTMAQALDTFTDYSSSEKRQHTTLSKLQSDLTISLISHHPRRVMLRVIFDVLVNQTEQIFGEKQAGVNGIVELYY